MKKKINTDWFVAALMRAIRTMAQTALGMFTVGAALHEIDWMYVLSVAVVAGIYSFLTSVATGLPETGTDGTIQICNGPDEELKIDICKATNLYDKKMVKLKVDSNTKSER